MQGPSGRLALAASLAALAAPAATTRAADAVADLLRWVPAGANVVLVVDVDALYRSEVAKAGKWGSDGLPTTGLDSLPAGASRLVMAAHAGLGGPPEWEVTVVGLKRPATEAGLARRHGGTRETVAGRSVLLTPRHGYMTVLAPGVIGAYQPPNRQGVGRWLREATGQPTAGPSAYLRAAAAAAGPEVPVVLAYDTADLLDPGLLKVRLGKADALNGKAGEVDALADLFAGLKGVTLTIRATDKLAGELRLDFAGPAAPLGTAVGKPLLLEALARIGEKGDEMGGWVLTVKGDAATFGGPLTEDTANLLLAPLLGPAASAADPTDPPGSADREEKAQASLRYFRAVQKIANEVRNSRNDSFERLTFRFNNGARRIDDLPILNVDDELLDWGAAMATTFRTMAITAQKAGGMISLAEANRAMVSVTTPDYFYGSGFAGGVGPWGTVGGGWGFAVPSGTVSTGQVSNFAQIDNMNAVTNQTEFAYRQQTWDAIRNATNTVRRNMVRKYGIEF
jgi:hypothetical protein